jgi:hypothetical protein
MAATGSPKHDRVIPRKKEPMNLRSHLTFANLTSLLALFLVLSGGTAVALNGQNTVQSDDLGPGAQVKAADVAANAVNGSDVVNNSLSGADVNESSLSLAAEPWHYVGQGGGEPPFNVSNQCRWKNLDPGTFNAAAFLRDRSGFVHLKGIVDAEPVGSVPHACTDGAASHSLGDYVVFVLPPGYRPAQREVHATLNNHTLGRVNISPNGFVHFEFPTTFADAREWIVLDGISFRCAPAGGNGCP